MYDARFGCAIATDNDVVVIGARTAPGYIGSMTRPGAAYVYQMANESLQLTQVLLPEVTEWGQFGSSVAISGNTIVVGAPLGLSNGVNSGFASIFKKNDATWQRDAKLTLPMGEPNDEFGMSVATDGTTVVIGAPRRSSSAEDSGAAYIYEKIDGEWQQTAAIDAPAGGIGDAFGGNVAVDGDTIAISAMNDDTDGPGRGSVYLYRNIASNWQLSQRLAAPEITSGFAFGQQLSMKTGVLAVTMSGYADAQSFYGAVVVYGQAEGGQWLESSVISLNSTTPYNQSNLKFARDVAIDGDRLAVGAETSSPSLAKAYYYRRVNGTWRLVQRFESFSFSTTFGTNLAIHGDTLFIGTPILSTGYLQGHVAQFSHLDEFTDCNANGAPDACDLADGVERDCNGNGVSDSCDIAVGISADCNANGFPDECEGADQWETARLTSSDPEAFQRFGWSVSLCGDKAIVGTGDYPYGSEINASGAYILEKTDEWRQVAKLLPADELPTRYFGASVAIDGDTAAVGAARANSDTIEASGAVYVFRVIEGAWTQIAKLTPTDPRAYSDFGWSVALEGQMIVVGAPVADFQAGVVYVFEEIDGAWQQTARLNATDPEQGFGYCVSIDYSRIAIGAPWKYREPGNYGSVYVFTKVNDIWMPAPAIHAGLDTVSIPFGVSVDLDGDTLVAGAVYNSPPSSDANGRALVFREVAGLWERVAVLTGDGDPHHNNFGAYVAVSGDTVGICDFNPSEFRSSDSVHIYRQFNDEWLPIRKPAISQNPANVDDVDRLGRGIAIDNGVILVGARSDREFEEGGAVYAFDVPQLLPQGDLNDDGNVDFDDVADFVDVLLGFDTDPLHFERADANCSGDVDGLDLQAFLGRLTSP